MLTTTELNLAAKTVGNHFIDQRTYVHSTTIAICVLECSNQSRWASLVSHKPIVSAYNFSDSLTDDQSKLATLTVDERIFYITSCQDYSLAPTQYSSLSIPHKKFLTIQNFVNNFVCFSMDSTLDTTWWSYEVEWNFDLLSSRNLENINIVLTKNTRRLKKVKMYCDGDLLWVQTAIKK